MAAASVAAATASGLPSISSDEIALYDRQIRLWGMQAQTKLRNGEVLLFTIKALGNEIAKNLVLAGVGSITIVDDGPVTEDDLGAQFLVSQDDIGRPRAQAAASELRRLNPRVTVLDLVEPISSVIANPAFFGRFSVVIATDLPIASLIALNTAARFSNRPFYAAGSHGMYGFIFADLIDHEFSITRDKSNAPPSVLPVNETTTRSITSITHSRTNGKPVELVTKREIYQPMILANTSPLDSSYLGSRRRLRSVSPLLPCFRAVWEFERENNRPLTQSLPDLQAFTRIATAKAKELQMPTDLLKSEFVRKLIGDLYSELSPVAAFLGGKCAEDVINVLGGREQPIQNMLLFDGDECKGPVYALYPIVPTTEVNGHGFGVSAVL